MNNLYHEVDELTSQKNIKQLIKKTKDKEKILEVLLAHFQDIFVEKRKEILVKLEKAGSPEKDNELQLLIMSIYLVLNKLYIEGLDEPCFPVFQNFTKKEMEIIKIQYELNKLRQSLFLLPVISYIEDQHLEILMDNQILPLPVYKLIYTISRGDAHIVSQVINEHGKTMKAGYYYNGFTDKTLYDSYLKFVYDDFYDFIMKLDQLLPDIGSKTKFLIKLSTNINGCKKLFCKIKQFKHISDSQKWIQKDALDKLKERVREIMDDSSLITFTVKIHEYMNDQYQLALKAITLVNSVKKLLTSAKEIDDHHNTIKVETNFHISEISVMLKLLSTANYVKELNITAISKALSNSITALKSKNPSYSYIRNKYHTPPKNAIDSTEKILKKLLDTLEIIREEEEKRIVG